MAQISVTRALTEIKHLNDRIIRATTQVFVGIAKGKETRKVCASNPASSVQAEETKFSGNLQSVLDMIAYRDKLKRLVVVSNATTPVVIGSATMTVAEAIDKKATIAYKVALAEEVNRQYSKAKQVIDTTNTKLMQEIDTAVQAAYGNEKGKVDEEQYYAVANPRLNLSELSLIDPNKSETFIEATRKECEEFMSEVDFVLSESNAKTLVNTD